VIGRTDRSGSTASGLTPGLPNTSTSGFCRAPSGRRLLRLPKVHPPGCTPASAGMLRTLWSPHWRTTPYAIGVAGFRNRTDKIKALAVSEKGRPAVEGTQADNLLAAVSAQPLDLRIRPRRAEHECDPKVREFMRFVLSREGQEVVASEGEYLPLPEPSQVRNWIG
jgi:phosphate transport system substrate-binding protein